MARKISRKVRNDSQEDVAGRCSALIRQFPKLGVQALLVTAPANVRYLSGFTGEDSFLLVGRSWTVLLTDGRFQEQARLECPAIEHHIRRGAMSDAVAEVLKGRRVRTLGFEAESMVVALQRKLAKSLHPAQLVPTEGLAAKLREVKDGAELAAIRRAIRIAQDAFLGLISGGAKYFVGRTEMQLAGELEYRMRQGGASGASFPSIVAAGAHAALPHYRPGSTKIRANQAVLFDWGAIAEGYCSDLTRVVFTGRIPPQIGQIYEVVLSAQRAGVSALREGQVGKAADAAAREVITSAGFGAQFGHGLGHGIGLEVHEGPGLSSRAEAALPLGSVVTVEPGIYLPGFGGVRIEDDVLVAQDRGVVLSSLPKDLQAMVLK